MREDQNTQIPSEIRNFLEGLLVDAGMKILDNTMREEMIKELYARLDNFMTAKIMENLPPEELEEFTRMAESKKTIAEMQDYLVSNIPNAQDVFTKAFLEFRDLYLGNVVAARNAPKAESQTS